MAITDRVKRKEDAFFTLFKEFAQDIQLSFDAYQDLVTGWPNSAESIALVKAKEVDCDAHLRALLTRLSESFITPFDREDINQLVHAMDDVPDHLEDISARFELFAVDEMRPGVVEFTKVMGKAIGLLVELIDRLPNFKYDQVLNDLIIRIHEYEDEGDVIYRSALADLFKTGDTLEIIKWKSLLDEMEDALDAVNDVSNVILGILLKNA